MLWGKYLCLVTGVFSVNGEGLLVFVNVIENIVFVKSN